MTHAPTKFKPIEATEATVARYARVPSIEYHGSKTFYRPFADSVTMPEPTRSSTLEEHYSMLLHKLAHSTRHTS